MKIIENAKIKITVKNVKLAILKLFNF